MKYQIDYRIRINNFYIPILVFSITFIFYWRTLAPGLFWGDGIEIAAGSNLLGPLHPTGYPLIMLLMHIFSFLPIGTIAYRANLFCCFTGAVASLLFYFLLIRILQHLEQNSQEDDCKPSMSTAICLFSAGAAMFLSASKSVWFHSITTEVYILHVLFLLLLLTFGLDIIERIKTKRKFIRQFLLYVFLLSLSFTNHLLTLSHICSLFVLIIILYISKKRYEKAEEHSEQVYSSPFISLILFSFIFFIIGLSVYIILPLRASANPSLNWGNPQNLSNFLWVISGGEFKTYRFLQYAPGTPFTLSTYLDFIISKITQVALWIPSQWITISPDESPIVLLILSVCIIALSIFGLLIYLKKDLYSALFIVSSVPLTLFFIFTYNIKDIEAYFLSILPILLVLCSITIFKIFVSLNAKGNINNIQALSLLFSLIAIMVFSMRLPEMNLSSSNNAEKYAVNTLSSVSIDSILLTQADNDIYPLWYLQNIEKFRTDVTVIGVNFLRCGWYKNYFSKEQIAKYNLKIADKPVPNETGFFYSILNEVIWDNLEQTKIFGFLDHPILAKELFIIPIGNMLSESEFLEDDKKAYLTQFFLYRYEKK